MINNNLIHFFNEQAILNKFTNHYGTTPSLESQERARNLAALVLEKPDFTNEREDLKKKWIEKKERHPTEQEMNDKLFSLALRAEAEIEKIPAWAYVNMNATILSKNQVTKPAPHCRLLGQHKLLILKDMEGRRFSLIWRKMFGRGHFNDAFLVSDLQGKEYIYRRLRDNMLKNPEIEEWATEVKNQQYLQDKVSNILPIYAVFSRTIGGKPIERAILVEYCKNGDLEREARAFPSEKKLTENQQKSIMKQLITTISEMHSLEFIHGDIKPGNILYTQDSDGIIKIRVADFGFTVRFTEKAGEIIGTPLYMPPEPWDDFYSLNDHAKEAPAGDVWALGVTAYEFKYGEFPLRSCLRGSSLQEDGYPYTKIEKEILEPLAKDDPYNQLILGSLKEKPANRCTALQALQYLQT